LTGRSLRYHKISYSAESMDQLLADLLPYGHQPERFFHG
jgi:hypothetical protein